MSAPLTSVLPCPVCGLPKLDGLCARCDLTPAPTTTPSRLAPGVYAIGEEIHFEFRAMLAGMGVADTPEHRAEAAEGIRLACLRVLPGTLVREV